MVIIVSFTTKTIKELCMQKQHLLDYWITEEQTISSSAADFTHDCGQSLSFPFHSLVTEINRLMSETVAAQRPDKRYRFWASEITSEH